MTFDRPALESSAVTAPCGSLSPFWFEFTRVWHAKNNASLAKLVRHRRHVKDCPHKSRTYKKCARPIWFDWRIGKNRVQKPMATSGWQVAAIRARELEAAGPEAPRR